MVGHLFMCNLISPLNTSWVDQASKIWWATSGIFIISKCWYCWKWKERWFPFVMVTFIGILTWTNVQGWRITIEVTSYGNSYTVGEWWILCSNWLPWNAIPCTASEDLLMRSVGQPAHNVLNCCLNTLLQHIYQTGQYMTLHNDNIPIKQRNENKT